MLGSKATEIRDKIYAMTLDYEIGELILGLWLVNEELSIDYRKRARNELREREKKKDDSDS